MNRILYPTLYRTREMITVGRRFSFITTHPTISLALCQQVLFSTADVAITQWLDCKEIFLPKAIKEGERTRAKEGGYLSMVVM